MTLDQLLDGNSQLAMTVEYQDEPSTALLFNVDDFDGEDYDLESVLETAEEEEADDDLVLCGLHPIDFHDGDCTQLERLFYYRPSLGDDSPVFSLDVDGTAVPGTLAEFAPNFDVFSKAKKSKKS